MVTKKLRNAIRIIIEGYSLYLRFRVLGISALTKIERDRLMTLGLVRTTDLTAPTVTDAYLQSHLGLLRQPKSRKTIRDYALRHIHESAGSRIDAFVEKAVVDLTQTVSTRLLEYRNEMIATTRQSLAAGRGKKTNRAIARELRDKTKDLAKDWDRVANSELARASSLGSLDAIVENNRGKSPGDIYVYKSGVGDHLRCVHCTKFWMLDGSPRVYKLSELLANGDNYGKKVVDWKPTVAPTHPNCREVGPLELPLDWGFSAGNLTYVGRGHNEWKRQRGY